MNSVHSWVLREMLRQADIYCCSECGCELLVYDDQPLQQAEVQSNIMTCAERQVWKTHNE